MAYIAAAIFALADVRAAARKGLINISDSIQTLPITPNAVTKVFLENEKKLKNILKEADFALLKNLSDRIDTVRDDISSDEQDAITMLKECTINYFGDDNADSDCVYLIYKNDRNKRITLCFRGSITLQDWIKDSKVFVDDINNPVSDRSGQPPTIGVHLGFKEYLYGTSQRMNILQRSSISSTLGSFMSTGSEESQNIATTTVGNTDESKTSMNKFMATALVMSAFAKLKEKAGVIGASEEESTVSSSRVNMNSSDLNEKEKKTAENPSVGGEKCHGSIEDGIESSNTCDPSMITRDTEHSSDHSVSSARECRLNKILEEIKSLRKNCEKYSIYITGHSLGGALGLLAALEAGTYFGKKGLPVTYIGIANPRGGTEGFRDAISVLEKEGKLRCLCVHGVHDVVPMLPASALQRNTKKRFCQSGIELVLEKNKFTMRYSPKPDNNYFKRVGTALSSAQKIRERHHYLTYLNEIKGFSKPLQKLHLNDYYNKIYRSEIFSPSDKRLTPMVVEVSHDGYWDRNMDTYVSEKEDINVIDYCS
eukprot:jgi/Psemu1/233175/estExt_Genewise1.C_20025